MDARRHANAQHLGQLVLVKTHFIPVQAAGVGALHQRPGDEYRGNALGEGGSQRHARYVHVQYGDEENVQYHVHHTGDRQIEQGAFGVPSGPENGGAEIVDHAEGDAPKVDLHIDGGQGQHIVRGAHHAKEGSGEGNADDGEEKTAGNGGGQGGVHRIVHHGILPAAKTMGNTNARADGQADKEIHQQVGDGAGGADSGYADAAAEASHNHQIGGVEQQLKQTGKDNGNGKADDAGKQWAFQHTLVGTGQENTLFDN